MIACFSLTSVPVLNSVNINSDRELTSFLLEEICNEILPKCNKCEIFDNQKSYEQLLKELFKQEIKTEKKLRSLFRDNLEKVLEYDHGVAEEALSQCENFSKIVHSKEVVRYNKNGKAIYYCHVGLVRVMCDRRFVRTLAQLI